MAHPEIGTGQVRAPEVASSAVGSSEIAADQVGASEIGADAVGSPEVANGALDGEDVGQQEVLNFEAVIGSVPAQGCTIRPVTGVPSSGLDHLILTPDLNTAMFDLIYSAVYSGPAPKTLYSSRSVI